MRDEGVGNLHADFIKFLAALEPTHHLRNAQQDERIVTVKVLEPEFPNSGEKSWVYCLSKGNHCGSGLVSGAGLSC